VPPLASAFILVGKSMVIIGILARSGCAAMVDLVLERAVIIDRWISD
jgi:hypothetical protein